jgi:hypothetical protein
MTPSALHKENRWDQLSSRVIPSDGRSLTRFHRLERRHSRVNPAFLSH